MKAGLKAHLASLQPKSDQSKPITGHDLHKPDVYRKFIEDRKANHQPVPPDRHISLAGHHWLKENRQLSGSSDAGSWMVAQWSPTELCWYRSNELATNAKPIGITGLMDHWEWKGLVPLPDLDT